MRKPDRHSTATGTAKTRSPARWDRRSHGAGQSDPDHRHARRGDDRDSVADAATGEDPPVGEKDAVAEHEDKDAAGQKAQPVPHRPRARCIPPAEHAKVDGDDRGKREPDRQGAAVDRGDRPAGRFQ